jgi:cytochrome P450
MAFGYGIHQCLGQSLARLELRIVLTTLFRRIPTLRLTMPAEELPYKHNAAFYGIYEVPVTW